MNIHRLLVQWCVGGLLVAPGCGGGPAAPSEPVRTASVPPLPDVTGVVREAYDGFNFRVPPVLLGWEDVDGDSVPEILDATPYGRSHR